MLQQCIMTLFLPRQYVATFELVPVAETDFSHRLTAYKIVGHFFCFLWTVISKTSPRTCRIISPRIVFFFESVIFQLSDRMLGSQVAQTLKSMDILLTLGSRSLSVTVILNFSGKHGRANTSIQGLGEDDTATFEQGLTLMFEHFNLFSWSNLVCTHSTTMD